MSTGQGDSQVDKRAACIDLPCLWLIVLMDNHKENGREVLSVTTAMDVLPEPVHWVSKGNHED